MASLNVQEPSVVIPPPPPISPQTHLLLRLGSFFSLVAFQTTLALVYKAAQGPDGRYRFNAGTLMLVAEAVKLLMSLSFFVRDEGKKWEKASSAPASTSPAPNDTSFAAPMPQTLISLPSPTFASSYLRQAFTSNPRLVPTSAALSFLYALNNQLTFLLLRNDWADSANFNLIKGGAAIVSTLMLYALGRAFSGVQWAAVLLQVCGLVIAQFGATCTNTPVLHPVTYLVLTFSLVITSICSVVNEKILKEQPADVSFHATNSLLYIFGLLFNFFFVLLLSGGRSGGGGPDASSAGLAWWAGWNEPITYAVLLINATIGIVVSAVYKYNDATMKTFAGACTTSILLVLNNLFHGMPFRLVVVMGCLTVFIATHLYAAPPVPASSAAGGSRAGVVEAGDRVRDEIDVDRSRAEGHSSPAADASPSPAARRLLAGIVVAAISLLVFGGYELPKTTLLSPTQLSRASASLPSFRGVNSLSLQQGKSPAEALQKARERYARVLEDSVCGHTLLPMGAWG